MWRKLLACLAGVLFMAVAQAADVDYRALVADIQARLDKATELYRQQDAAEARVQVQGAYFEVFENLEGPIRINLSAQKSIEMESAFGDLRKMIAQGKPQADVEARVATLKQQLSDVIPALESGHKLVAEGQHDGYDNDKILPYWQQSLKTIDDLLAEAMSLYEAGQYAEARQKIQQAQYDGYKNSEMEIAVRQNRSADASAAINKQFTALMGMASDAQGAAKPSEFGYEITTLLQDVTDLLPGLPATREDQNPAPTADATPSADWKKVSADIADALAAAIAQYEKGDAKGAMLAVQDAYFDHFEASGMENKIGARDATFKSTLEGYFTRMVSLIKAGRPIEQVRTEAAALDKDLARASEMLGSGTGEQGGWALFVYSLLIIVREGLEALLIVAAIIAYLVKNDHRDKLPLIRQSVIVALVASLVTAGLFQMLFTNSGASRELLEGITMLIAVFMLFSMSYWLLAKVEARQWKAYLEGKLSASLTRGSLVGLWLTSFLAVYREGAETVLFYFALVGDATTSAGHLSILAGFLVGCVLLLIAYVIMRFTVVKLPLKPFFLFTGSFMYLMAFVFAGKGVLELIEGKLFEPTLVHGVPQIALLGIYPYLETLLPQAALLVAAAIAGWVLLKKRPAPLAAQAAHS
ncbi:MAG: FTR1 family iron permease [Rhodocyclaceae bacterium]